MLARLTHAAIAFAATVVIYQIYVVLAVPFIDPGHVLATQVNAEEDSSQVRRIPHKYREILATYFPAGHWTLTNPPKTFESERLMVVMEDYVPDDKGHIRVTKCALIFFPRPRVLGEKPPLDAVVLEAANGALLQLDEAFRPGLESLASIEEGILLGEVVVRSNMRQPGPQDDLLLKTREVRISRDLVRTEEQVHLQLGPHRGQGRVMEIRLLDVERGESLADGFNLGGLETLDILYDVQAELVPQDVDWLGQEAEDQPAPPIRIQSDGRFRFHFAHYQASFVDHVQVSQTYPSGAVDQLDCEALSLFLSTVVEDGTSSQGKLRPGSIRAVGKNGSLVTCNAPSQRASARCESMWFEFGPRRITLDGSDEVVLNYQGSEIHAPMIRYTAPADGSSQRIGNLLAAGDGWIRAQTGDDPGDQPLEVHWDQELRLQRIADQLPVMTFRGRPRLEMIGTGRLWSNEMEVHLRESAADGSEEQLLPSEVVPKRIIAKGQVAFDSAELYGEVNFMDVQVDYALPANELAIPRQNKLRSLNSQPGGTASSDKYRVDGNRLNMLLTVRQNDPEVTTIDVDGQVVFQKLQGDTNRHEEPMIVRADHIHVKDAHAPDAVVALTGRPATVVASGSTLRAAKMRLNRGTGQAWVESPGDLQMPVQQDLSGRRLTTPTMMHVQWQGGMQLNQDLITVNRGVIVEATDGRLETEQLDVRLSTPVNFTESATMHRLEVAQLGCSGGAYAQFNERDSSGLTSVQTVSLDETLTLDQRSGQIVGTGGGWMESVHLAKGSLLSSTTPPAVTSPQRLRFLHVDFVRGVEGNLHQRKVNVMGNVEAVYGPVDSWEKKLQKTISGMPGRDTLWISADKLGVASSPMRRLQQSSDMGPVELQAVGDVTIEGPVDERGNFTTHSHIAKFDQFKNMFVLEANRDTLARLTVVQYPGAPPQEWTVKNWIQYFHTTGQVKAEGVLGGSLRQLAP